MTMGDEGLGEVSSSSGLVLYQQSTNKYQYGSSGTNISTTSTSSNMVKSATGKMLANYSHLSHNHHSLHGHHGSGVVGHRNPVMAPVAPSFTVLAGIANVGLAGLTGSPDHSLPSSDIGEVDLDLWDLDINAPSASPSSGGHSPAAPLPGRRSSDTSSTSG